MKKSDFWIKLLWLPICFVLAMLMAYIMYMLCRVEYVAENWSVFGATLFENPLSSLIAGSWKFDTSAIVYTNIIFALLMLLPIHFKERKAWRRVALWVFVVVNGICMAMNLADSVYFKYTGRRTTMTVFSEFGNENNLGSVMATEFIKHWYLVLMWALMVFGLWKMMSWLLGKHSFAGRPKHFLRYYICHALCMLVFIPLALCGMRGGATKAVRPITVSNANQYVKHPGDAAVILNTPFSMLRTIGKSVFKDPKYFSDEELDALYSPVHYPCGNTETKPNIVILIVESFGREYIGAYNERLEGGSYKGYTPFIDSLYEQSLSFDYTFSNGRKSIDGMPSILSSIPMFEEPFFLTPASMNELSGIAGELQKSGYSSAFFHGAENGSMGFQAFANATGFDEYYGRTEYNDDSRFGGDKDFDGTWAIWDEPFLQFYALKMTEMKEPFVTAVFTASSHHPYVVPEEYKSVYPEEGDNVMHKCIRYTDHALERFFDTARKQPWFDNTIFVFTSDHTNLPDHEEYKTDLGLFGSPILFYDPSGRFFTAGRRHCIAQQIDIMPTLLDAIGYDKPYVAFGKSLISTADADTWAINYNNGVYQFVKDGYLLQWDGAKTCGLYNIDSDWLLKKDLTGSMPERQQTMEQQTKAIIQSYMQRLMQDRMIAGK